MNPSLQHVWYTHPLPEPVSAWLDAHGPTLVGSHRLGIYGDGLQVLAVYDKSDALAAVQVLYQARIRGVMSLSTPPFCPWTGPFIAPKSQKAVAELGVRKRLLEAIASALLDQGKPLINVVIGPGWEDVQPLVWAGFQASPKYTYQIDLTRGEDDLLAAMDSKRRNQGKKGGEAGYKLQPVPVSELAPVARTHLESKNAFHEPEAFAGLFALEKSGLIGLGVFKGEELHSWFIFQQDTHAVYYLFGGAGTAGRGDTGSWGMWTCIRHFKQAGIPLFDFEGSMIPEIERYFRSFGGTLVTHFAIEKKSTLQKAVSRVLKR